MGAGLVLFAVAFIVEGEFDGLFDSLSGSLGGKTRRRLNPFGGLGTRLLLRRNR
jgi:hypothetical protein